MLLKRISIIFVLLFSLFIAGCVSSPPITSVKLPKLPKEGIGTYANPDGKKYVGEFKDYKFNGQGTLTWPNGMKYIGEWKDDTWNGQGTLIRPDGIKYVGGFKDGKKNGQGTQTWPNGAKYVGEFKDDSWNGQGTLTVPNGTKYVGEFKDNKKNGQGTMTWPNGTKYVGEYKDNKQNGQGTMTYPDGTKYVGEYKDGKGNGQGAIIWTDGAKYVGEFKDGDSSISGKYIFPNGSKTKGKLHFSPYIVQLFKDSQAERLGLRVGDIVVEYNDIPTTTGRKSFVNLVSATNSNDIVTLKVLRDKAEKSFTLNGGKLGIGIISYPIIPANVNKTMDVAASYSQNILTKNKMNMLGRRWAVIIGVSNYKDTRIPPLRYASEDAKSFYDWVISPQGGKYPPSQTKLLLNNEATGRKIKDALYTWLKQALEEDVVAIYFAGHGSPESPDSPDNLYLLPYDTDYQNIASTGFPMWDIETALKRFIKAKKVVVIADACHAGGVGQSFDVARRANRAIAVNPISSGFQNLSQIGDGVCVISASDDKQFSQESKKWGGGHGVFTYFLLEGLKGEADYNKDSNVTLGELIPFISEQVRRATTNAQAPTVAGKFDPALSIGR